MFAFHGNCTQPNVGSSYEHYVRSDQFKGSELHVGIQWSVRNECGVFAFGPMYFPEGTLGDGSPDHEYHTADRYPGQGYFPMFSASGSYRTQPGIFHWSPGGNEVVPTIGSSHLSYESG